MPPRKTSDGDQAEFDNPESAPERKRASVPPGPHLLQVRVNDKVVLQQRVHSYNIDQQDDALHVHGVLRLPHDDA